MRASGERRAASRNIQFTLGLFALLAARCWLFASGTSSLEEQAQIAWQNRSQPNQTERAIELWQEAYQRETAHPEILVRLTQACGRALRHASNPVDKKKWADRAKEYGEQAVAKNPQSAEAFAYYGESLGQWAEAHKGIHSLSKVREAVNALKKSTELNPKYAYAHMLLASFYLESPTVISVRDKQKALAEARLAVEYGPSYAINHLVLARILLDLGKKDQAILELQKIGTLTPPQDAIPETRADQETAATLLQSLGMSTGSPPCGDAGGVCSEPPQP